MANRSFVFPYKPRVFQKYIHTHLKRFNCIVLPRQHGKTYAAVADLCIHALCNKSPKARYAVIANSLGQGERAVWEYFNEFLGSFPGYRPMKSKLLIELVKPCGDRTTIFIFSSTNADNLRGTYLDYALIDEMAFQPESIFDEIVRPMLAPRRGRCVFISTPQGMNHFYDKFKQYTVAMDRGEDFFTCKFDAYELGILPREELESLKATMSKEAFAEEYMCSFEGGVRGSYFGEQLNQARLDKRIGAWPHNPALTVDTFWDIGRADKTAIWFRQRMEGRWRYIDYHESSQQSAPFYVNLLKGKPYVYGKHVVPHDGAVTEWGTGKSRDRILRDLGLRSVRIQKRPKFKHEGIEAARQRIAVSCFDEVACERGLACLFAYSKKWDSKRGVYANEPKKDWSDHGSDAFRYSATDDVNGVVDPEKFKSLKQELEYDIFNYTAQVADEGDSWMTSTLNL